MNSIRQHQTAEHQSERLISDLQKLWKDHLVMITICSELISSKDINTSMEKDVLDAVNWISEKWSRISETEFQGENPWHGESRTDSVYHDTVMWLSNPRPGKREYLAAKFIRKFMRDSRQD